MIKPKDVFVEMADAGRLGAALCAKDRGPRAGKVLQLCRRRVAALVGQSEEFIKARESSHARLGNGTLRRHPGRQGEREKKEKRKEKKAKKRKN
jgi:hypothetical protein